MDERVWRSAFDCLTPNHIIVGIVLKKGYVCRTIGAQVYNLHVTNALKTAFAAKLFALNAMSEIHYFSHVCVVRFFIKFDQRVSCN